MKISYNWLKRYLDLDLPAEKLADMLPMLGHEVGSVEQVGVPPLAHVVVGEILSKEQHPDADRLSVCLVDVGDAEPKTIVCGATNHKAGDRVIVALPGAVLPGNFKIKKSKLRGVASEGMMCSAGELGLPSESEGIIILEDRPTLGTLVNEVFQEGDVVFDLELTANRGDCLSHIGIARELAAKLGLKTRRPEVKAKATFSDKPKKDSLLRGLRVESEQCPYYTAWMIRGVTIGPSPRWMQKALQAIGLRPINNVVDITNYVMHECGQPLHAFDAKKISEGTIIVRQAKDKETITTLDEKKRELDPTMMVIADAQKPMVVAGVMGSLDAEVDGTTKDIVLEAAYFRPSFIRKTARKLMLATDSSHRFARDVDPECICWAAQRAIDMILEIAGGTLEDTALCFGAPTRAQTTIEVDPTYIQKVCGFAVEEALIETVFGNLGFEVDTTQNPWKVTVPSFRSEVERPIDLAEEFLRVHGTDKIPPAPVVASAHQIREDDPVARFIRNTSRILAAQSFNECCHYSLVDAKMIEKAFDQKTEQALALDNPLTSDLSHLRPSLIPGLLQGLKHNLDHGNPARRLFETGRVFLPSSQGIEEWVSVAFVILQEDLRRHWKKREGVDFFSAKALAQSLLTRCFKKTFEGLGNWAPKQPNKLWQVEHSARLDLDKQKGPIVNVGLLDIKHTKELGIDEAVLGTELLVRPSHLSQVVSKVRFRPFSGYPNASKDLALVVGKEEPAEKVRLDLLEAAQKATKGAFEVTEVRIFDVFDKLPDNKKSLAFELTFRCDERTLKEKEIQDAFEDTQKHITQTGHYLIRT